MKRGTRGLLHESEWMTERTRGRGNATSPNVLVLKLRAAQERKRARGERVGGHPAERAVLDRMIELRRKRPNASTTQAEARLCHVTARLHDRLFDRKSRALLSSQCPDTPCCARNPLSAAK